MSFEQFVLQYAEKFVDLKWRELAFGESFFAPLSRMLLDTTATAGNNTITRDAEQDAAGNDTNTNVIIRDSLLATDVLRFENLE